ncbi:acylphosphatase [Methylocaldum marinum]|uniref:Acylphosphatase n=1 Tax=Methylocaldum marinum TaxID=1432792 RepID=A0A250KN76_9GAMM|nr:acylphosphatase [Methylocaldum marinum]BBA33105.1 acylphosphatase [Methylocaldum marinum]
MPKRIHVFVSGLVQGVFFRAATRERAVALGIKGWVRNLPDGRVEILAEGASDRIAEFLDWCASGPPRAKVDALEVIDEIPSGGFVSFEVQRHF